MTRIGVMQLTDSLAVGGLERVAVNLANHLPREQFHSHLCSTRSEGPLREQIMPHVRLLNLNRSGRFDLSAIARLREYVKENRIQILHAHGTTLFVAAAASMFARVNLIWHDHFGRHTIDSRPAWLFRLGVARAHGIISVSAPLA